MTVKEAFRAKVIKEGMPILLKHHHPEYVILDAEKTGIDRPQRFNYPNDILFVFTLDAKGKLFALSTNTSSDAITLRGMRGWINGVKEIEAMCKNFYGNNASFVTDEQFLEEKKWFEYLKNGIYWVNAKTYEGFEAWDGTAYLCCFSRNGKLKAKCMEDPNMNVREGTYSIRPIIHIDSIELEICEGKIILKQL